jgi:hypothetical protein
VGILEPQLVVAQPGVWMISVPVRVRGRVEGERERESAMFNMDYIEMNNVC